MNAAGAAARRPCPNSLHLPDGHANKAGHALIAEDIIEFRSGPK